MIDDCSIDLTGRDDLPRVVDGTHLEVKTSTTGRGLRSNHLDGGAHPGSATMFNPHRRPNTGLTRADKWRGGLHGRCLQPCDQPRSREHRYIATAHTCCSVRFGHFIPHRTTLTRQPVSTTRRREIHSLP